MTHPKAHPKSLLPCLLSQSGSNIPWFTPWTPLAALRSSRTQRSCKCHEKFSRICYSFFQPSGSILNKIIYGLTLLKASVKKDLKLRVCHAETTLQKFNRHLPNIWLQKILSYPLPLSCSHWVELLSCPPRHWITELPSKIILRNPKAVIADFLNAASLPFAVWTPQKPEKTPPKASLCLIYRNCWSHTGNFQSLVRNFYTLTVHLPWKQRRTEKP